MPGTYHKHPSVSINTYRAIKCPFHKCFALKMVDLIYNCPILQCKFWQFPVHILVRNGYVLELQAINTAYLNLQSNTDINNVVLQPKWLFQRDVVALWDATRTKSSKTGSDLTKSSHFGVNSFAAT